MEESSNSIATEKSASGIQATVKLYVKLGNISALVEQKLHRLKLLGRHEDTSKFDFRLREGCQKDIAAIDAGIRELLKREVCRGHIDVCTSKKITGWAQYVRFPEIPVMLGIYFDQELAGRIAADRYRRDLEEARLGSGRHSFEFLPEEQLFLSSEVVEVKTPNGTVIGGYRREAASSG